MPRYVALLRAINVGGHVVRMSTLCQVFEALEFGDVSTYIASGNVLFRSASRSASTLEQRIAAALEASLGYPVATFVRTPAELQRAAAHTPFDAPGPRDAVSVGFLARALTAAECLTLQSFVTPDDDFTVHARELFWRSRVGVGKSKFSLARFERAYSMQATFRNISTVRALAALASADK